MVSPVVAKICILFIILIDGKVVSYKALDRSNFDRQSTKRGEISSLFLTLESP